MKSRHVWVVATTAAAVVAVVLALTSTTSGRVQYEVWAIDQSDSPGKTYGGTLYIWDGHELEKQKGVKDHEEDGRRRRVQSAAVDRPPASERIDLGADVSRRSAWRAPARTRCART